MNAFVRVPLEEICTVVGGGTPRRSKAAYFGGTIPWATPTDVTRLDSLFIEKTNETITKSGLKESSARLVPAGTVLMTSRATIGYTAVATRPMATNQGFANLICGERIVPEFLAYWLRDQRDMLMQLAGGTTFREIPKSTLKKVRIPLPLLDEQRRIVGILNRAAKIEWLRKQAQERFREFMPALFIKMFGDPVENPMGWEKRKIEEVCDKADHKDPKKNPKEVFRYVDISSIDYLDKKINAAHLLSGSDAPSRARKQIQKDDVLVSCVRPNLNAVAIVPDELDGEISSTGFCVLRPNLEEIEPYYLFSHTTSSHFVETINQKVRGANYPAVSDNDIRRTWINLPPISEQRKFTEIIERANLISGLSEKGSSSAGDLTMSIMSRLL